MLFKGEGFNFAYTLRTQSIVVRKPWGLELETANAILLKVRKQKEMKAMSISLLFLFAVQDPSL